MPSTTVASVTTDTLDARFDERRVRRPLRASQSRARATPSTAPANTNGTSAAT